jgi:signal peptidase II
VSDQITKSAVDSYFHLHESHTILGNYLKLTYIRNSGAAFGVSIGNPKIMFAISVFVTILLAYLFLKGTLRPTHGIGEAAVVLVLGGAVGNIIDRIRLGEVIDFIDMGIGQYRWPVYNFADVYVTVGMFILFITYGLKSDNSHEANESGDSMTAL